MKKSLFYLITIVIVAVAVTGGLIYAQTKSFPDVQTTDWFYNDVMNMVDWDVIRGNDDGTFRPANNVNRAELSAMWNRYDARVQSLISSNIPTPSESTSTLIKEDDSTAVLTEKTDYILFLLTHQQAKEAYLYGELAAVSSMLFYETGFPTDLSCNAYKRYYNSAKDNIDAAKVINDSIELNDFKITFTEYDKFLADFRGQYPDCNFNL